MDILFFIIMAGGASVAAASGYVIKYVGNRPANGELKTLERLDAKIIKNQKSILRHFTNYHHV